MRIPSVSSVWRAAITVVRNIVAWLGVAWPVGVVAISFAALAFATATHRHPTPAFVEGVACLVGLGGMVAYCAFRRDLDRVFAACVLTWGATLDVVRFEPFHHVTVAIFSSLWS
jgi:hypothetical protein